MVYDLTLLHGASMVDFILIANFWTGKILFIGLSLLTVLIVFAISKYSNQPTSNAFISSLFSGFFIALFMWLLKYNGEPSIPTYIPFIYAVFLGVAILMKVRE